MELQDRRRYDPLIDKLHELTGQIIEQRRDQGWLIRIGYGLFLIGLALTGLTLTAIFQAGGLKMTVERNQKDIARMEQRLDDWALNQGGPSGGSKP